MNFFSSAIVRSLASRYLYVSSKDLNPHYQSTTSLGVFNSARAPYSRVELVVALVLIVVSACALGFAAQSIVSRIVFGATMGLVFGQINAERQRKTSRTDDATRGSKRWGSLHFRTNFPFVMGAVLGVVTYNYSQTPAFLFQKLFLAFSLGFCIRGLLRVLVPRARALLVEPLPWFSSATFAALLYFLTEPKTVLQVLVLFALVFCFVAFFLRQLFSVASTIAVTGIAVGTSVLIVVMGVTSGFPDEIQRRVVGAIGDAQIEKYGNDFSMSDAEALKNVLQNKKEVVAVSPLLHVQGLGISDKNRGGSAMIIAGIDISSVDRVLTLADFLQPQNGVKPTVKQLQNPLHAMGASPILPGIFLGDKLCKKLGLSIGDTLKIVVPGTNRIQQDAQMDGRANLKTKEFRFAGVVRSGYDDYDRRFAYIDLASAQELSSRTDAISSLQVKLTNSSDAPRIAKEISEKIGAPYHVVDWTYSQRNLFLALLLQKAVLGFILCLVILVASFNVVAAVSMLIFDRTAEIAILKTLGMSKASIRSIFRTIALQLGVWGALVGVVVGVFMAIAIKQLGYLLNSNIYMLEKLPIYLNPIEIVTVALLAVVICLLATIYPTRAAANLNPVDGLRYE